MSTSIGSHTLATTAELGLPQIDGADAAVLSYPAYGPEEGLRVTLPNSAFASGQLAEYGVVMDLYLPGDSAGSYVSLLQTGDGDGDVFLKSNGDGTYGLGISGEYHGSVPTDTWVRVAFSVSADGDGSFTLNKYVNGVLVNAQDLSSDSRWAITQDAQMRFMVDNGDEVAPGALSSLFIAPNHDQAAFDAAVTAAPTPTADGFAMVSADAVAITFEGETIAPAQGRAAVDIPGLSTPMPPLVLFSENWESVSDQLGPLVSESEQGGDGTDWTATAPDGWTLVNNTPDGGPVEFHGWTFFDAAAWAETAEDQGRGGFDNASGVVAVADPDEYDDGGVDIDPSAFNASMISPTISLDGADKGAIKIAFDSSWRPEDAQEAAIFVTFDGGQKREVMSWSSDSSDPNYKADATNERVELIIDLPDGASGMQIEFAMPAGGNDWWWAIDNIEVTPADPVATDGVFGNSKVAPASEFGIDLPGNDPSDDIEVLNFNTFAADEGLDVAIPRDAGDLSTYTLVWDLHLDQTNGPIALLQTNADNQTDADLFVDLAQGLGVDGAFDGSVSADTWTRIAITVEDLGDGTATLTKFIDGAQVGTQTVDAAQYTLTGGRDIRLLSDNDGEAGSGYLAHFGVLPKLMTAQEVSDLGGVDADGPFDAPVTELDPDATTPVVLNAASAFSTGAVFTKDSADTVGLTFESSFAFRIDTSDAEGNSADGLTFQIVSEREGESLLGTKAGGDLGLPVAADGETLPSITIVYDTWKNDYDAASNQIRILVGGDAESAPVASIDAPLALDSGAEVYSWVEYDGTTLSVFIADTDTKPATAVLTHDVDLASVLGDSAKFGFSGASGGLINLHEVVDWDLTTSDANGPSGNLLQHDRDAVDLLGQSTKLPATEFNAEDPFQIGFDDLQPVVEFGYSDVTLTDNPTVERPFQDMLVSTSDAPVEIDLFEVFGTRARDFAVTNSNGDAVEATIEDGVLTLEFAQLGLSDLTVTATGAFGIELSDDIRVRVAGENAYTIAILPDTQNYRGFNAGIYSNITSWLAENADNKKLGFVTHVGDITNDATNIEFANAHRAMDILRDADIPFSVLPGNHDMGPGGSASDRSSDSYNRYFSTNYMSEDPTFGGVYDQEPGLYDNNYHLWDAPDGTGWIILNLEFGPRDDVLRWADDVLTQNGDRKAFVLTHSYNNFDARHSPLGGPLNAEGAGYNYGIGNDAEGAWDGEEVWREVIAKHPNVVFTAGGHIFGDGAETIVSQNDFDNSVYQFLVNYQGGVSRETTGAGDESAPSNGGNGAVRLVVVDPDNDTVHTETYFTELDTYFTARRGEGFDRDGLTGEYVGHEETFTDANIGARSAQAIADAGDLSVVAAEAGEDTATVSLDARRSSNPNGEDLTYRWFTEDGDLIAEGAQADVELGAGAHDLILEVKAEDGTISRDSNRVIVSTDDTYLVETFDDGDAQGWTSPSAGAAPNFITLGTDADFGLPALGDGPVAVAQVDDLAPADGIRIDTGSAHSEYTLVYDIYVANDQGNWAGLFQTDLSNGSDGDLFLRRSDGDTGGIGISGTYDGSVSYDAWNRIAFTLTIEGSNHILRKFVNGALVGTQTVSDDVANSRFNISEDGFLIFADESNETMEIHTASFAFVPTALSVEDIQALGAADADGPFDTAPAEGAVQFNFDGSVDSRDFGTATLEQQNLAASSGGLSMRVIGSTASRDGQAVEEAGEGALYSISGGRDNMAVWGNGNWDDIQFNVTIRALDNDTIGTAFRFQDADTYYLLSLNVEDNTRQLIRVEDGVQTVLAEETGGYRFNDEIDLEISAVGGRITVSMDGVALFGGAVVDADPLGAGTVGLYTDSQSRASFDDIVVRAATAQAEAGPDRMVIDWDGDGIETVTLNGTGSVLTGGTFAGWSTDTGALPQGLTAQADLAAGRHDVTLDLGNGVTDTAQIDVVTGDRLVIADQFEDAGLDGWTIVDTTEIGSGADWAVVDGALVERSGSYSRELTWAGATNSDVWQRGWSPHGDGVYALHKGTYALAEGNTQLTDYTITADITVPVEGGVGFMLSWVDVDNYLKLEIDARHGLTSLVKVVDGYESNIARMYTTYSVDETFNLSATIKDQAVMVSIDGHEILPYAIADLEIQPGAAGLFSWGAAGAAFDNVAIIDRSAIVSSATLADGRDREEAYVDGVLTQAKETDGADAFNWSQNIATYDDQGQLEQRQVTYDDGRESTVDFVDGARVASSVRDESDSFNWVQVDRDYDSSGALVNKTKTFDTGLERAVNYVDGQITEVTQTDGGNAEVWSQITTSYDDQGQAMQREVVYDDGRVSSIEFADGVRSSSSVLDQDDVYDWLKIDRVYDVSGTQISQTTTLDDGSVIPADYEAEQPLSGTAGNDDLIVG